jgi:hypothetical protein
MIARLMNLFDRAPEIRRDLLSLAWVVTVVIRHRKVRA